MNRRAVVRQLLSPLLCLALVVFSPAALALDNGGFESHAAGLDGWTTFNDVTANVLSAPYTPRLGSRVAKVFGGFNGTPNFSGLLQGVPASPGQTWRASCYARHNAGDSLVGTDNAVVMKIEFYRVFGASYGGADFLGEHEVTIVNRDSPEDRWLYRTFQATAPAQTVEARIAFVFIQPSNQGGAALLDVVEFGTVADGGDAAWDVIWSDEFNGATVDRSKWRIEDLHIIKNNELQYYAPDEVFVDNGNLVLRSRQRSYWGFDSNGAWRRFDYTSGLVSTWDRFSMVNGRIEIRAKLPGTQGMWPAHWMLSQRGGWPPEIDIMEMIGSLPNRVTMSLHWGPLGPNGEPPWEIGQTANHDYWGPDFTQSFHTFALEWWPGLLMYYVDDVLRFSTTRPQIPSDPMYLILNTAVGGDWPGSPDGGTVWPQYHDIDYVRAYVPADPGLALFQAADATAYAGTPDGQLLSGEYDAAFTGINNGFGDIIGANSELNIATTSTGLLTIGIDSVVGIDPAGVGGAVIYIDSTAGGVVSTAKLGQPGDLYTRLAAGLGTGGQLAEVYKPPGYRADAVISLGPDHARVFHVNGTTLVSVHGADLNAPADLFGGRDVRYVDNAAGDVREFQAPLELLHITPRSEFRMVATFVEGDSAYRSNEFFGVGPGNHWDDGNPGLNHVTFKQGDFIEFTAASRAGDLNADNSVDAADWLLAENCLSGPCAPAMCVSGACGFGDFELDGDVDVHDVAALQRAVAQ